MSEKRRPRHEFGGIIIIPLLLPCPPPSSPHLGNSQQGTHSLWIFVRSPTSRGGACSRVSCLDLWVHRFPTNFKSDSQTHCQSVVGPLFLSLVPLIAIVRAPHMRFSSAFTPLHSTAPSSVQQPHADQIHLSPTDAGSPDDPWDPGVSVAQRQTYPSAPAPPTTPADGPSRHKDRGEVMYSVPKRKRSDAKRRVGTSHEDEHEPPFIPHHALPDPRFHHPSDPHAIPFSHTLDMHVASRAREIAAHPVR